MNKVRNCKGQWHTHKHLLKSSLSSMPVNVTLKITLHTLEEQTHLKSSMLRGIRCVRAHKLPVLCSMVSYNIWVMEIAGGS